MFQFQRAQIDNDLYQVLRTIYHYEQSIAERYGLNFEQIYVLQFVRRHPEARLTEISAEMGLPKFTASRLISRLVETGHITKTQDSIDHRNHHIQLKASGEKVLRAIEDASYEGISANLQSMLPVDVARLVEMAENLHILLGVTDRLIEPAKGTR